MVRVGTKPGLPKVSAPHNGLVYVIDTQTPLEFSQASDSHEYSCAQCGVQSCALPLFPCIFVAITRL